jgi:hypothetical protein
MVAARRSERLGDTAPEAIVESAPEDELEALPDFAAEDVEHLEEITPKRAMLVCGRCGATLAAPDL